MNQSGRSWLIEKHWPMNTGKLDKRKPINRSALLLSQKKEGGTAYGVKKGERETIIVFNEADDDAALVSILSDKVL